MAQISFAVCQAEEDLSHFKQSPYGSPGEHLVMGWHWDEMCQRYME